MQTKTEKNSRILKLISNTYLYKYFHRLKAKPALNDLTVLEVQQGMVVWLKQNNGARQLSILLKIALT